MRRLPSRGTSSAPPAPPGRQRRPHAATDRRRPTAPAERHSSAAAAATVSHELPETDTAAAVCCSGLFGPANSTVRIRGRSGGSVFHKRSYIHELHGRLDAIKLGHPIDQWLRKEGLRRLLRFPDIEIERLPVDGINREGLGSEPRHAFELRSSLVCDLPYTCLTESALIAETNQDCNHVGLLNDAEHHSSAAGSAARTSCPEKPSCRPRLLQRLDTH